MTLKDCREKNEELCLLVLRLIDVVDCKSYTERFCKGALSTSTSKWNYSASDVPSLDTVQAHQFQIDFYDDSVGQRVDP